jgi:hypothetical protein
MVMTEEGVIKGPENPSDGEYLQKLRIEYLHAIQLEDYGRINGVIVPQFLERFGRHYEEYAREWKDLSLSRLPVQVIIDPGQQTEKRIAWAEHVLTGQIDLTIG